MAVPFDEPFNEVAVARCQCYIQANELREDLFELSFRDKFDRTKLCLLKLNAAFRQLLRWLPLAVGPVEHQCIHHELEGGRVHNFAREVHVDWPVGALSSYEFLRHWQYVIEVARRVFALPLRQM